MKHRKNLGCLIKGTKERGAWAELYFMVLAMSQGLKVSSPYGGLGPYDVGVEDGGPILRVQVKCTLYQFHEGCYSMSINVKDGSRGRRGYAPGTVDFFAITLFRRTIGTSFPTTSLETEMRMSISGRGLRAGNIARIGRRGICCVRWRGGSVALPL